MATLTPDGLRFLDSRRGRPLGEARIEGFVRVHNRSGEDYEDAEIRVVVGKINLVEKIAQLRR